MNDWERLHRQASFSPVACALLNCSSVNPWSNQHSTGINFRILPLWYIPCLSWAVIVNMGSSGSLRRRPCCRTFSRSGVSIALGGSSSISTAECSPLWLLTPESCLAVIHRATSVILGFTFISMKYNPVLPPQPPALAHWVHATPSVS